MLVIGEAMKDVYHLCHSSRLSPEAPIPVCTQDSQQVRAGGAANVSENLKALGALVSELYPYNEPTKHRIMIGDEQIARYDTYDYCEALEIGVLEHLLGQSWDAVVISDYGKGAFPEPVCTAIVTATLTAPYPVFVDSKLPPTAWSPRFTFFPNGPEYTKYFPLYALQPQVVHKMGAAGMEYLYYGVRKAFEPATALHVRSVIGAGDSVMAAFAFAQVSQQADPPTALAFAAQIAAQIVSTPFTSVPGALYE